MGGAANLIRAIGSLWPLAVVVAVVFFRRPIGEHVTKLAEQLRSLKVGPVEAAFWRRAYETRASLDTEGAMSESAGAEPGSLVERLERTANVVPVTAIEEAYGELLDALRERLISASPNRVGVLPTSASGLARRALEAGLIRASVVPAVEGLTALRNLAAHRGATTPDEAREFLTLTDATMYAIRQSPEPRG